MNDDQKRLSRRAVLAKLGIAAGMIYAAPVLLRLSEATASSFSSPGRGARPDLGPDGRPLRVARRSVSRPSRPRRSFSRRSFSR